MPHFTGKKSKMKKVKQVNNGTDRNLLGNTLHIKPITDLQFNIPKGVDEDKRIKPAEVFEGFKENKTNKKNKTIKTNNKKSSK
tara:strand:+ start:495 stop:743 length:249 start_codon:yes stop_codon:yes gene_type:complete